MVERTVLGEIPGVLNVQFLSIAIMEKLRKIMMKRNHKDVVMKHVGFLDK